MHREYGGRQPYSRREEYDMRAVPPHYERDRGYDRYDIKRDRSSPYERGRGVGYHRDMPEDYHRYRDDHARYKDEHSRYRYDPPRYRDDPPRYRDEISRYRDEPSRYRDEPGRYRDDHMRYRDDARYHDDIHDPRRGPLRRFDDRPHYSEPQRSKIFIGNLEGRVGEDDLKAAFSKFGPINKIDFRRSFAFVDYVKHRDAEAAMREMNGRTLMGATLKVVPHSERSKRVDSNRQPDFSSQATVLNLDDSASWQDLKDFGRQAGEVVYASVIIREQKRYGLIEFANPQAMRAAVEVLNGKKIAQNELQVVPMAVNDYIRVKTIEENKDGSPKPEHQSTEGGDHVDGDERKELIYHDEQLDSVDYD